MRHARFWIATGFALAAAGAGATEIYRCTVPGGSVSYQQQPCATAAEGGAVAIPTSYPDHVYERERLAAREAAADARLLKRLEIEAAERIARDERIAREKEAEAERLRLAQIQAQATPFFVVALRKPLRHRPGNPWQLGIR